MQTHEFDRIPVAPKMKKEVTSDQWLEHSSCSGLSSSLIASLHVYGGLCPSILTLRQANTIMFLRLMKLWKKIVGVVVAMVAKISRNDSSHFHVTDLSCDLVLRA